MVTNEIIIRMSNRGAQVKNWAIVSISGIYAIQNIFNLEVIFIILWFWILNTYYLNLERKFRKINENVFTTFFRIELIIFYLIPIFLILGHVLNNKYCITS